MTLPLGKRVVVAAFGETPMEAVDHLLHLEDQPPPAPDQLGPNDVLVSVRSAAVGWVDLLMTSGQYQHMPEPPYTPGLEYSGEVTAVGSEVSSLSVGDAVLADGLQTGPRSLGRYRPWGGFANYAIAPEAALRPLPDGWTFDQGACLLGNYETAWHCLVARGRLAAGETVLVHGASGSTGLAAVDVARLTGAKVIATGRSPEKLDVVLARGADHVVCTGDSEGGIDAMPAKVKELTDGRGVDVVYDGVGGPISAASMRCTAFGARFLVVGWAATPFVARGRGGRGAPNANVLPTNLIMMKGLDVLGCPTAITTHRDPTIRETRLAALNRWIDEGSLRPYVGNALPLTEFREAMHDKWESRYVGGCVVRP